MKAINVCAVLLMSIALAGTTACTATRTQKTMGEQIDDTVILAKVKSALIGDDVVKAQQVDVEVFRGIVQLNGFVDTATQRARAAKLAGDVNGVREIRNNLTVAPKEESAGEVVDDSTITAKVKSALAADSETNSFQINVETRNGVVQLAGFVDHAAGKAAATRVASGVSGVRRVENRISVK